MTFGLNFPLFFVLCSILSCNPKNFTPYCSWLSEIPIFTSRFVSTLLRWVEATDCSYRTQSPFSASSIDAIPTIPNLSQSVLATYFNLISTPQCCSMLVDFGVNPCATNSIGEGSPDLVHAVYQHIREQSEEVNTKKPTLHLQTRVHTTDVYSCTRNYSRCHHFPRSSSFWSEKGLTY